MFRLILIDLYNFVFNKQTSICLFSTWDFDSGLSIFLSAPLRTESLFV